MWGRRKGSREERNVGIWEKGNVRLKGMLEGKGYGIGNSEMQYGERGYGKRGYYGNMGRKGMWE